MLNRATWALLCVVAVGAVIGLGNGFGWWRVLY